ncbi:hypothetical protein SAMN05660206_10114 [Sphingobacterium wenxiniae]|uniref:Uncharacterized protein n=1 Tax=Sphingobacterium wenxiniae TaxID=683125 RepID=A0A1I6NQW5_9SPHI|nr:hypothetical protein SAMN05660206_10114 [Sphingobacterium wenxiniae]
MLLLDVDIQNKECPQKQGHKFKEITNLTTIKLLYIHSILIHADI